MRVFELLLLSSVREQKNAGKEAGGIAEVRLVLPVPDSKGDSIICSQFDLAGISGRGA